MAVTREQLLADPTSGARPLCRDEQAERVRNAELAAHWLLATSPSGRPYQIQVNDAEVLEGMRRAGWHIRLPCGQPEAEPETA
jgi:hypothetical protein